MTTPYSAVDLFKGRHFDQEIFKPKRACWSRTAAAPPAPARRDDATLIGEGWMSTLKPGFVIREGERKGDYEVVRQQP
jgi:hypothetical protein